VACSGSAQVAVVGLSSPLAQNGNEEGLTKTPANTSRKTGTRTPKSSAASSPDRLLTLLDVGKTPVHLALKPDSGEIFVSNFDADTISEIATGTNEVGGSYVIGAGPVHGVISADNSTLYVSNFNSDSVGVYSIDDGRLVSTVHVGSRPDALALSPNQNF